MQSIFKRPKEVEVRRCQIWAVGWMWQHRPTHFGDVFLGSQACVRACIVMLEQHFSVIEHTSSAYREL
jgi:hypothetical protein